MSEALAEGVAAGDAADAVVEDAPVVEAPAAPAYDPTEDPRVLDLVRSQAAQIAEQIADQRVQQLIAEAQRGQAASAASPSFLDQYGNFDPEAFAQWQSQRDEKIAAQFEATLAQATRPFQEQRDAEQVAEGMQQMRDVIADLGSREGELIGGDTVVERVIANVQNVFFPDLVRRGYPADSNRTAEMAIERAYRAELEVQKAIETAAIERHVNRNAQLASAQGEPGAGAGSGVVTLPDKPLTPRELALKYGARADGLRNTA